MPKQGYSGYKREHVGSGWGKLIGGHFGSLPGMVAGHYVGKSQISEPHKSIEEKKASHRIGVVGHETYNAKRMAKGAALGAVGGVAGMEGLKQYLKHYRAQHEVSNVEYIQYLSQRVIEEDDEYDFSRPIGAAGGAILGTVAAMKVGSYKAAKRLGYGKLGKAASFVGGPIVGLLKPKTIRQSEKKEMKEAHKK